MMQWIQAHPLEAAAWALKVALGLVAVASLVIGATPSRLIVARDVLGFALRVVGRLSAVTPPDAPGTLKAPGWPVRVAEAAWLEWQATGAALLASFLGSVRPPAHVPAPEIPPSPLLHPDDPSLSPPIDGRHEHETPPETPSARARRGTQP